MNTRTDSVTTTRKRLTADERVERQALRDAAETIGLQMITAADLSTIERHALIVSRRHQPNLDTAELESIAVGIAAQLLAQGSDRPRIATLRASVKIASRRVIADRMRGMPRVVHSDDLQDYTSADVDQLKHDQRAAVVASQESSYLWPIARKYPKVPKIDATTGNSRGAEGDLWRGERTAAIMATLETTLGADLAAAIESAYVAEEVAKLTSKNRAAGTLLSPAKINWQTLGESLGVDRGTIRSRVITALGGNLETVNVRVSRSVATALTSPARPRITA